MHGNKKLIGTLVEQLSNLVNLKRMDLSGCSFKGGVRKLWRGEVTAVPNWGTSYVFSGGKYYNYEARIFPNPNFPLLQILGMVVPATVPPSVDFAFSSSPKSSKLLEALEMQKADAGVS